MGQRVAKVTLFAVGAGGAVRVVQALQTLSGAGVTRLGVLRVDVAAALARATLAAGLLRVAIETRSTAVTPGACRAEVVFLIHSDLVLI